jgi:hypothetical protein
LPAEATSEAHFDTRSRFRLRTPFSAATLGAPQSALDIDVAELLVACTLLVGPERALSKAVECHPPRHASLVAVAVRQD